VHGANDPTTSENRITIDGVAPNDVPPVEKNPVIVGSVPASFDAATPAYTVLHGPQHNAKMFPNKFDVPE